jgi:hypothetical protein
MKDRLQKLSKDELISLLISYNNYIINFYENLEYYNDSVPVCVMEFYDNEYQEEINENE